MIMTALKHRRSSFLFFSAMLCLGFCFFSSDTDAFHWGGGDYCRGCHGAIGEDTTSSTLGLLGGDASSTCLRCHDDTHRVLTENGSGHSPGGDFYWLTREYSQPGYEDRADSHGHNIVAVDYGLTRDAFKNIAPSSGGGTFSSSWLECSSCHDPHGLSYPSYDFRMLRSTGWIENRAGVSYYFPNPSPAAVSYSGQGGDWPAETDQRHTDYGEGMSEWCSNCHVGYTNSSQHSHAAGGNAYLNQYADLYNRYVSTGDFTGSADSAYDHFVPFERGVDENLLDPYSTHGPDSQSRVMCLTCHRAHASPFANSGRWDFRSELIAESPVFASADSAQAFYGSSVEARYGSFQRSLCNKCHVQD